MSLIEHLYELRTYTAEPGRLDALDARFRDHTIKLFDKHGMTNVAYWHPVKGEKAADTTCCSSTCSTAKSSTFPSMIRPAS